MIMKVKQMIRNSPIPGWLLVPIIFVTSYLKTPLPKDFVSNFPKFGNISIFTYIKFYPLQTLTMLKFILTPETTAFGKIRNIGFVFAVNLLWICFVVFFLNKLDPESLLSAFPGRLSIGDTPISLFFFACIAAPLWEEAAFRYAPITIAKSFGQQYLLPVIVISSVLFGWGHGDGPISLMIQGVAGFLFSLLYIKNNYSYVSTVVSHFLWNLTIIFLVPILAQTS